jgi:DNA-binding NarL/FixJ family response regulator
VLSVRTCRQPVPLLNMPTVNTFIVEDSPIILDNLVATLEELAPVKVVGTAADEASAVRWLVDPAHECELVIIDVFLKSGSGLGVLKSAARAGLRGKRVVLTNYATPDLREKCAALGADRVFDKSGELDELIDYCTRLGEGAADTQPGALV